MAMTVCEVYVNADDQHSHMLLPGQTSDAETLCGLTTSTGWLPAPITQSMTCARCWSAVTQAGYTLLMPAPVMPAAPPVSAPTLPNPPEPFTPTPDPPQSH